MESESSSQAIFAYRLTLGNMIAKVEEQPALLQLYQGVRKDISDGTNNYYLLLRGIKVNRKIYQPTEIEAELDIMQATTGTGDAKESTVPKFSDVRDLLLQREVSLDIMERDSTSQAQVYKEQYNIASNCYVYEMTPMLKSDGATTKMYVKLSIFSMDKLMTLNKYSKAYVARKLGAEILQPESLQFGTISDGVPLIESDIDNLRHLTYAEGKKRLEFIQPYLVQYNESFYDFLVRTSNRCGEFLYFEDGKLVLGLPDSGEPVTVTGFDSVTVQETSSDPLTISGYARDSVKDGIGAVQGSDDAKKDSKSETYPILNISAIAREETGFPKDAFPAYTSSNAELAQDDYIFPLYKGMFTNRKRELNYDGTPAQTALARSMQFSKTLLANELPDVAAGVAVPFIIEGIVGEAIPTVLGDLRVKTWNSGQGARYIETLKEKSEQYNEQKAVQFGTLNTEGWTTLNYYQDIFLHEEAQQRKIICIDMGTCFIPVRLGQKIRVNGLDDVYVIIQIQQNSEEAWIRNYNRYGMVADDKFTGKRSLKIYAIPAYGEKKDQFIPPVHPVPVIRKVGPQTAFVTDNEDPKFQGRVRVAFPWQSLGGMEREELEKVSQSLKLVETTLDELKAKNKDALSQATKNSEFAEELKKYVKSTQEEREQLLQAKKDKLADVGEGKDAEREQIDSEISDMKAAAEEHDQKEGEEGYKDLENDNTIICKYHKAYKEAHKRYHATMAELERVGKDKEWKEKKCQKLVKHIEKDVNDMATPWVRVVTPMATPGGGTFFRPRVGDEVLVNFENGNVERPYVMGSVFSKNNLTPDEKMYRQRGVELQGRDVSMAMMSPNGHHITFTDPDGGTNFLTNLVSPGLGLWGSIAGAAFNNLLPGAKDLAGGIHIGDRYGIYEIDMKSHKRAIEINSPYGTVSINAFSGITINAPNGDVTIRGKNINLEAGNKVNILSGLNIKDPDLGDPEGKANSVGKAFTDVFAEYLPAEIFKYFFVSTVDLSYIRHVVEVIVRPVDGTLKLKSKRYLMLEAGKGNATIRRDRYATKVAEKKESQEEFFKAMLTCVEQINKKVDGFYDTYETLWTDGYKKRVEYEKNAKIVLRDVDEPNLIELAGKTEKWRPDAVVNNDTFKDHFSKDKRLKNVPWELSNDPNEKFSFLREFAVDFAESAFKMYVHIKNYSKMVKEDELGLGAFDWVGKCCREALKEVDDKCIWAKDWMQVFANGNEDKLFKVSEPDPETDKFAIVNKKIFKRKLLLTFISKVGEAPENANNKYFSCGLRIDEILQEKWILQEFYWNRTVFFLDRTKGENYHNFWRTLKDNTWGLVKNKFKSSIKRPFDRDIWNDTADGQILFSDQEDKTLNFDHEGLHEESSSNIGTLDHLKKELMAMK
mgnify:CR=1 FL=1